VQATAKVKAKAQSPAAPKPRSEIATRLRLRDGDAPLWGLVAGFARLAVQSLRERALWLSLVVGLLLVALAYQSPRSLFVDIGGALEGVHTPGFYAPEKAGNATYRWSSGQSAIVFRGLGMPADYSTLKVELQLSSGRDVGALPVRVEVYANGHPLPYVPPTRLYEVAVPLVVNRDSKSYEVTIPSNWINASGDLRLDFHSPTFRSGDDQRDLAFTADFARVQMPGGFVLPSLTQLGWLALCGLLLYWLLRSLWLTPRGAGVLTLLFLVACACVVAVDRLLLTTFTTRLAVTLALALVLALGAEIVTRWLVQLAGWKDVPEWAWAGLRALVAVAVVLKVGGLLYPSATIVDAPFHLKYITYMSEGRSWRQFFGETLARAVMPEDEWGSATAFIPYSPYFYLWFSPLAKLPLPLSLTVPVVSGILEALRVPLVFIIGLALSGARRAPKVALAGAAVYSFVPATFLLQQWGNWPTLISLWLLTAWAAVVCLFWKRINHPLVWLVSTGLLTLTMLSYTVTAVYTGIFIGMILALGWIFARGERRRWLGLLLSTAAATALSVVIYYGQWLGVILEKTLPTFGQAIETQGSLTTLRPTLWEFVGSHMASALQSYNLAIFYALGLAGVLWVFFNSARTGVLSRTGQVYGIVAHGSSIAVGTASWQNVWLAAWLLTLPLFTLADFWVDQALKEFWYSLPAVAVVAGVWLLAFLRRGAGSRVFAILVWLLAVTFVWQSLSLWVFRLFFHGW
jgi:hypothetical protein